MVISRLAIPDPFEHGSMHGNGTNNPASFFDARDFKPRDVNAGPPLIPATATRLGRRTSRRRSASGSGDRRRSTASEAPE